MCICSFRCKYVHAHVNVCSVYMPCGLDFVNSTCTGLCSLCVCVCTHICMYTHICIFFNTWIHAYIYYFRIYGWRVHVQGSAVCVCVCVYVHMYIHAYVYRFFCIHVYIHVYTCILCTRIYELCVRASGAKQHWRYMFRDRVCVCVCTCVNIYTHIYIYIYIFIHTYLCTLVNAFCVCACGARQHRR